MHILCVEQFANIAGGQRTLLDLLPEFVRLGWEPTMLVPGAGPLADAVRGAGCAVELIQSDAYSNGRKPLREVLKYTRAMPGFARTVDEIIRRTKIQFVYINGPRFLPPVAWAIRRNRLPSLFHCHSRLLQRSAIGLAGYSLRLSRAHVLGCCAFTLRPLTRFLLSQQDSTVIYNGVESHGSDAARPYRKLARIGVIGRIEPEKGQREFIECAKLTARRFPRCRFVVAGAPLFSSSAYYESVLKAAQGLPVEFIGWQSDVANLFSQLDVLVVPSRSHEATTRVIPEAYSARLPVVALPSGGIPEIVRDGQTGFLARGRTPEALADRLSDVLRMNFCDLTAVTARARKEWEQRFTLERYRQSVGKVVLAAARKPAWTHFALQHTR